MAEFSFPGLTAEAISDKILDEARQTRVDAIKTEVTEILAPPPVEGLHAPVEIARAEGLLKQARGAASSSWWRNLFRSVRRQPRMNGLILGMLHELIKILRRYDKPVEDLHERIALASRRAFLIQEQVQEMVATSSKRHEELAAITQRLTKIQNQQEEDLATLRQAVTQDQLRETVLDEHFDYLLFEERFRGERSLIKRRQESYLELFRGKQNVIDLGCGRGEFVELLAREGIPVIGVDFNKAMADCGRERGLNIVQMNLFDYLKDCADESIDGVFTAQVIEHLTPPQIIRLIGLCRRKLKAGGVMVAETVNPNCLYALGNFYLDPTHVKPVPVGLLQFIFEQAAFEIKEIRFNGPVPGLKLDPVLQTPDGVEATSVHYQDYAIIALRPSPGD